MEIGDIRSTFRPPEIGDYPELTGYTREEIYQGKMGPGGLFLAAEMSREVNLSPGCRIMDLACGTGTTSAFFAKHFDAQVSAVDLWVKPGVLARKFEKLGALIGV